MSIGLILEGGGMRGAYTAGILDCWIEHDIQLQHVYGVSAGACHACSYVSGQKGRAIRTITEYLGDRRYAGLYSWLTTGDFFGVEMVYNEIPRSLIPFDYDAFDQSPTKLYAVVSNCRTGEAEYHPVISPSKGMQVVQASSSLPLLSRKVKIGNDYYLDGGITDSIPLARSIADGNPKNVVILTQHRSYRKKPNRLVPLLKARYRTHPQFVEQMKNRHTQYNSSLDLVFSEEKQGRAFVLAPHHPVTIGRLETDKQKLYELYWQGYRQAEQAKDDLLHFLSDNETK